MSLKLIYCPNCNATATKYHNQDLVVTCHNCLAEYKPFAPPNSSGPKFTFSSRKPTQAFIEYIQRLLRDRQKEVSNVDLIKHQSQTVKFYSISQFSFGGMFPDSQTNHFSDMVMIEIEPNGKKMTVSAEKEQRKYEAATGMQIGYHEGRALLYWRAISHTGLITVVKLMSPDGIVQIKLISQDGKHQEIHNVCELPNNFQLSQWIR